MAHRGKRPISEHRSAGDLAKRAVAAQAGDDGSVALIGPPPNFERLEGFFASLPALATALGVEQDTVCTWREGRPARVSASAVTRVRTIASVAEDVAGYLSTERGVGCWLLAPHPGLSGLSPADWLGRDPDAYPEVLRLLASEAGPASVGDISDLPADLALGATPCSLPEPARDPDADPDFLSNLA